VAAAFALGASLRNETRRDERAVATSHEMNSYNGTSSPGGMYVRALYDYDADGECFGYLL
jgi:hypothetical protein